MEGPPLGPVGQDITWPDQVAPRGRKASSTRKIKPQTSNLCYQLCCASKHLALHDSRSGFVMWAKPTLLTLIPVRLGTLLNNSKVMGS